MTLNEAQQILLKWQERGSTVVVRLDVKEVAVIFFGSINAVMDDRVMLDGQNGGHLRISLLGEKFKLETKRAVEFLTIRYSTGYCTFGGVPAGQTPQLQELVSEFEQ
jgi:hypothetical protein